MPKSFRIPSYRHHKCSGQAVVVLSGKSIYLGPWGSPESQAEYERVVAEWLATGQRRMPPANATGAPMSSEDLTITEMIAAFWGHAQRHYRHADGTPTREIDNLRAALRPLRRLYGPKPVVGFGPLALRAIQEDMVKAGLCRRVINDRIKRIRRAFRWAVSVELAPPAVVQALETVPPLKRGRCDARESAGVRPVNWEHVQATLPHLPRAVAAMVQVMRFSNCRAEDVVILRGCDLTMRDEVWEFKPHHHKNSWREDLSPIYERIVQIGPQCQDVLRPFLQAAPQAYLFSPRAYVAEYQAQRAAKRKTPMTPSQRARRPKANARRAPRDRYSVNTFQQTIRKTCRKLGLPVWTVLQVRHSRATEVRERYGLEGAAASLGDSVEAARIYAERNTKLARQIAQEIG